MTVTSCSFMNGHKYVLIDDDEEEEDDDDDDDDNDDNDDDATVPPFWLSEPRDVTVLLGQPIAVPCQADGYPKPNVTWIRNSGNSLL